MTGDTLPWNGKSINKKGLTYVSSKTKPFCDLISAKNLWVWGPNQQKAFEKTKQLVEPPTVLARYTSTNTMVSADASVYVRICTGWNTHTVVSGNLRISFISRSLIPMEQKYSEKKRL